MTYKTSRSILGTEVVVTRKLQVIARGVILAQEGPLVRAVLAERQVVNGDMLPEVLLVLFSRLRHIYVHGQHLLVVDGTAFWRV